ncbi:hypothetical protein D5086_024969 [Populus alba]|uniref:Uncharacterized protein n=1 Tax=Populus alba TaxID=43335 RepID=A0ACC4B7U8_POPAL
MTEDSRDMDVNSKLKMRFSAGSPFWISRFHCISAWLTKNDGKSLPDKVVQRIVKKLQDCKAGCGGLQRIFRRISPLSVQARLEYLQLASLEGKEPMN